ncbi:MAG: hypothetical protein ACI8TP_001636 [Acidimicrobiales bacterium]|jgi:hypothetical protein
MGARVTLQPGERAVAAADMPLVVYESRGTGDRPLVVCLPGAIHLGRIFYGHVGSNAEDFLAHHLEAAGWPVLAVSYPLEVRHPAFERVDPDVGLAQLADAIAEHVGLLVTEWELPTSVVVLGWSAAGNIAPRLNKAMEQRGITLEVFVALAATPAVPGLIFGSLEGARRWAQSPTSFTSSGLIAHEGLRSFEPELEQTDLRYQRTVISVSDYQHHYVGNMPLNLFPGLDVRREAGEVVVGHAEVLAESRGTAWSEYPMVASLEPTWRSDGRHVVTDFHNWGMVLSNMLHGCYVAPNQARLSEQEQLGQDRLSQHQWTQLTALVRGASGRLNAVVEGGHMFFVGKDGAATTVGEIDRLLAEARTIKGELEHHLTA